MSKRVEVTQAVKDQLSKNTDGSVDASTVAIYECVAINTLPVSKKGTLFDKGRMTESMLKEMADWLNAGDTGKSVPLHTMHDQGYELPIGRAFYGEIRESSPGVTELRALFYVPLTETNIISKLDSNVIDEVSVGVRPKHICCSECGFDYLGESATFSHIWSQTCENEHEIGVNGVHTISSGLDKFMELSLVSKGAASNAKILARTKQLLGKEEYNRLAASGVMPEMTTLFFTTTKDTAMDMKELVVELTTAKASVIAKDADLLRLTADNKALADKVVALEADNVSLKAKVDVNVDQLKATAEEAKKSADLALAFIRAEADRLCVAAGAEKLPEAATFEVLTASIQTNRLKLADTFPAGGVANSADAGQGSKVEVKTTSAFKLPK